MLVNPATMSITTTKEQTAGGMGGSPALAGRKIDYLISYLRCSICYLYYMHSSVQRYKQLFFYRQRRTF